MSKSQLFHIAQANHQAALEQAEAMAETARHDWTDILDTEAYDMHRRLFDIGGWEEGDDSIIF